MRLGFFITPSVRVRDLLRTPACKRYFILWISAVTIQQIGILHIAYKMLVHCCIAIQMWLLLTLGANVQEAYCSCFVCLPVCLFVRETDLPTGAGKCITKALAVQADAYIDLQLVFFLRILH